LPKLRLNSLWQARATRTKFHHIISQLEHRYAAEVEDIIISQHQQEPYTKLRIELLNRLSPSREQSFR
jgi:hypothetical protein